MPVRQDKYKDVVQTTVAGVVKCVRSATLIGDDLDDHFNDVVVPAFNSTYSPSTYDIEKKLERQDSTKALLYTLTATRSGGTSGVAPGLLQFEHQWQRLNTFEYPDNQIQSGFAIGSEKFLQAPPPVIAEVIAIFDIKYRALGGGAGFRTDWRYIWAGISAVTIDYAFLQLLNVPASPVFFEPPP